jgi:hypothetical protein
VTLAEQVIAIIQAAVPDWVVHDTTPFPGMPIDGDTTIMPGNWVVVTAGIGVTQTGDVARTPTGTRLTVQVTCVSALPVGAHAMAAQQSRWAAARIRDTLLTTRVTPGGGLFEHTVSNPPTRDDEVPGLAAIHTTDQYTVLT